MITVTDKIPLFHVVSPPFQVSSLGFKEKAAELLLQIRDTGFGLVVIRQDAIYSTAAGLKDLSILTADGLKRITSLVNDGHYLVIDAGQLPLIASEIERGLTLSGKNRFFPLFRKK